MYFLWYRRVLGGRGADGLEVKIMTTKELGMLFFGFACIPFASTVTI